MLPAGHGRGATLRLSFQCVGEADCSLSVLGVDLQMITHSQGLPYVLLIDMFALLSYNFAGMCVTGTLCILGRHTHLLKSEEETGDAWLKHA